MRMQARGPYDRYKAPEEVAAENKLVAELHARWRDNTRTLISANGYVLAQHDGKLPGVKRRKLPMPKIYCQRDYTAGEAIQRPFVVRVARGSRG